MRIILACGLVIGLSSIARTVEPRQGQINHPTNGIGRRLPRNSQSTSGGNQFPARPDLIIVEAPGTRADPLADRFPHGSRLTRLAPSDRASRLLTAGFFAAADPRISFDGKRVLFSAKKTADTPWQIWEMNIDGSGTRQITHERSDCLKPEYLPRGQIVFTVLRPKPTGASSSTVQHHYAGQRTTNSRVDPVSEIWVSNLDGSGAGVITFGPGDFQVETVLKNGMILATANSPLVAAHGIPTDRELYTLRPDGTGLATLRCNHQHPAIRSQARELEDGSVVFVETSLNRQGPEGDLTWIRRGAVQETPIATLPIVASCPQPIKGDQFLVTLAAAHGTAGSKQINLSMFEAGAGRFLETIYEDQKLSTVEAVPVAAHEPPRWYWSTMNPALQRGYFVCLDSYLAEGVPKGQISAKLARVRVLTLDPSTQQESRLGEAPIEEDGSFYIAVPPDTPVRFEVLTAAGRVVREQRSWIWSRSGEERGCAGCHEDRALAPENRWPMALRRFDTPVRLDLKAPQNLRVSNRQ